MSLAIVVALTAPATATSDSYCDEASRRAGLCSIETSGAITGDAAVLEGNASRPGADTNNYLVRPHDGIGIESPTCTPNAPVLTEECDHRDWFDVHVVTLADIARFRPTAGVQRMEPDGWVVVGLPANFYALVDPQVVPGQLLGQSADVRFTPISWLWDYGDGATATRTTKGGTWAALGLREFDATPTSHTYRTPGDYTVRLSIRYRAEYRIGGGAFVPITGTIVLPANELRITAGGAKTVLVDRDCTVAPRGPGC